MTNSVRLSILLITLFTGMTSFSQRLKRLDRQETKEYFKTMPGFSMHKDIYFITGVPMNRRIDNESADIKFQISFKQMITRTTLPWNSYLFVSYTQNSFWNAYKKSSPFKDHNYNPAIGLGKPVFNKEDKLAGLASLEVMHNSNGQDSIFSRSWNRVKLKYTMPLDQSTLFSAELWAPFGYKGDNSHLLDYEGLFKLKLDHEFIPHKLRADVTVQKGLKDWNGKFRARLFYSPFKSQNQYLMLEWFAGHSENLLNYKQFKNMIRVGYAIKTRELGFLKGKSKEGDTDSYKAKGIF